MHPTTTYELAKSHIANLYDQAEHDTRARVAGRLRRTHGQRGSHPVRWLGVLIIRLPTRLGTARRAPRRRDTWAATDSETA
jgi:hypothetical protein